MAAIMAAVSCRAFAGGPAYIAICCRTELPLAPHRALRTMLVMTRVRPTILVVDDDDEIRSLLQVVLTQEGFEVYLAKDAASARKIVGSKNVVDLIILDIMMPGEDGLSFCQRLRETQEIPILMVSARSLSVDRSIGLESGADDYLPKPFERRELVARVKSVLRRTGAAARRAARRVIGGFTIDCERRAMLDLEGTPLPLTSGEFDLLGCFIERPARTLSRDQLIDWTRGRSSDVFDRNIDVQMSRLRKKLVDAGFPEDGIKTVRNAGYVLTLPVDDAQ
jgi:two-component system, OmpR family, response regulator